MAIVAKPFAVRSDRARWLLRGGVSATALSLMTLASAAQAQVDASSPVVSGANQSRSPTGAKTGPGTAGAASPASTDTGTAQTTVPHGTTVSPGLAVTTPDAGTNAPNEVIVTGIRQSLANAQNIKRNADTIVDAITAQDIGALPDRSVTEALQRVPGVSINRFAGNNDPDHFSVEGSGVSVRGLNFVRSEFNGRDTFSAGVGGQAINFADVPAELLGSVEVYKNATAEQIEGGLAGTVNLNTRKPFDNNGFHAAIDGEANYGDLAKRWSPTGSFLISNTWDTDSGKFGILADVSYSQLYYRTDGIQVTNVQTRDGGLTSGSNNSGTVCRAALPGTTDQYTLPPAGSCGLNGAAGADGLADATGPLYSPIGAQFRTDTFDRQRQGIAVATQWQSSDERTLITAQFLRSHATTRSSEYTFETAPDLSEYNTYPNGCVQNTDGYGGQPRAECPVGKFQNYTYNADGLFQSGYITQPGTGYRTANSGSAASYVPTGGTQQSLARQQTYDSNTVTDFGLNAKVNPTDRFSMNLDGDYTRAVHRNEDINVFGSTFADTELDISGGTPRAVIHKPSTLNAAWAAPNPTLVSETDQQYFMDKNVQYWRAAMDHFEHSNGREYAFKGDFDFKFDPGSFLKDIKFGARYADRSETVRYSTYNWGALSEVWSGTPVSIAQNGSKASFFSFPNFYRGAVPGPVGGYYYNGDLIKDYDGSVAYFNQIAQQWKANGSTATTFVPAAQRPGAIPGTPYLPSEIQRVGQEDTNLYAQLNFATPDPIFGDVKISGNVGVRYVGSRITSAGAIGAPSQLQLGVVDPYATACAPVTTTLPNGQTQTTTRGGVCNLGAAGYAQLQQFATGQTIQDNAVNKYHYFLPSANLKIGVTRNLLFRLAASKVLTRPDLANIRDFITVGTDPNSGTPTATAGNPYLKPATAWQFDATVEWYFGRVGQLSFDAFYKSVHNFFYSSLIDRSITSNGITETVQVRGPANYSGYGKIKGFEASYQQTFDFLPKPLDGLGANLNYTYIRSSGLPNSFLNTGAPSNASTIAPSGNLPFEGLSRHNANATVFYEKGPISVRLAYDWRSKFLLTAADVIFPYTSIFQDAGGQLDGSIFFNVNKYVKVGVQGVNLTNQTTKLLQAYVGDPNKLAPRSYFINDRRYSFIVRANF